MEFFRTCLGIKLHLDWINAMSVEVEDAKWAESESQPEPFGGVLAKEKGPYGGIGGVHGGVNLGTSKECLERVHEQVPLLSASRTAWMQLIPPAFKGAIPSSRIHICSSRRHSGDAQPCAISSCLTR